VTTWFASKGYGFIRPDNGDKDAFFCRAEIAGRAGRVPGIREGVYLELAETPKGLRAVKVVFDSDHLG
jgi:cold shock protein